MKRSRRKPYCMPDKPSILFINRVYPPDPGATGRMLRDLAQGFAASGWTVTVLTTGSEHAGAADGAVAVRRVGRSMRRKSAKAYLAALIRLTLAGMRLPRHDVVVSMTDPPMLVLAGRWIARAKGARHAHWCQDVYPDLLPVLGYRVPDRLLRLMSRQNVSALNAADRVVVIGRCMARALVMRGVAKDRLTVIPNWPDCELATAGPATREGSEKFRVLYAGTLGRAHPVDSVLDAAAMLRDTHPEVEFLFVGQGDGHDRLAEARSRLNLDNVRQLPRQPAEALAGLMAGGDLHLIAMHPDAAGLLAPCKLYAALATGRPVLLAGPEHSEAGRVIKDYGCGLVVPHDEPHAIAEAIAGYATHRAFWREAADRAGTAGEAFGADASIGVWIDRAAALLPQPESLRTVEAGA